jgi:TadE-like protein
MNKPKLRSPGRCPQSQRGAGLIETVVVLPTLFFLVLGIWQAALAFQAKSSVNYATFEAARAGSVNNASVGSIRTAFIKGMLGYYGGGQTLGELASSAAKAAADLTPAALRIEVLSPTQESFSDYASPELKAALKSGEPVIPNVGLDELNCPRDVPGCKSDPKTNASGQTLLDANLLKLRVTYGIPQAKQMPMVGRFYTWALGKLGAGAGDAFKQALIEQGRIPIVSHVVVRMQSDAIRNTAMASLPGPGNGGTPSDPGPGPEPPKLPTCPYYDPGCRGGGTPPPPEEPPCF